ncbi:hypothetical protein ACHHYP_15837 [Achlya hypogyna]|uniref:Tubulin-tyrosine ligase family n=1 Tax=Achlya hypogyna TaxID=1202772 RepID=A0A1V9ZEI9_ACHHY|nr:hypothetical protein ACHHYP_15837 [Achlya hypogyna]
MLQNEVGRKWRTTPWTDVLQGRGSAGKRWNKYFMRSGLIRKDILPLYGGEFMPRTTVVSSHEELVDAIAEDDAKLWVLKLCDSSNAYGIHFFDDAAQVEGCFLDKQKRVVQQYVDPWLTRDGRKFHLRVLVLAVGHLDVHVFHNIRALIATKPYRRDAFDDPLIHVTNMSTNRAAPGYNEGRQNVRLEDIDATLDTPAIRDHIHSIVGRVFANLCRQPNRRHFFSLPNCYELFGFDFVIDASGRVLLLEVNPDPSLGMYHGDDIVPPDVLQTEVPTTKFTRVFSRETAEAFDFLRQQRTA